MIQWILDNHTLIGLSLEFIIVLEIAFELRLGLMTHKKITQQTDHTLSLRKVGRKPKDDKVQQLIKIAKEI